MSTEAAGTETAVRELGHFIGGEFGGGGETFDDLDPFSGDLVAKVAAGGRDDAKRAIDAAADAFTEWSQAPPAQRQAIFLKAADVLESRRDEVVSWLARETGSTFGFGMFQMSFVPGLFRQAAALAYAPIGQVIPSDHGEFAMGLEVVRGQHVATLPVTGPRMFVQLEDLAYERREPAAKLPSPVLARRKPSLRAAVRKALDWETVTPLEDLPASSFSDRVKKGLRWWRDDQHAGALK
jgi:hypothetical protein